MNRFLFASACMVCFVSLIATSCQKDEDTVGSTNLQQIQQMCIEVTPKQLTLGESALIRNCSEAFTKPMCVVILDGNFQETVSLNEGFALDYTFPHAGQFSVFIRNPCTNTSQAGNFEFSETIEVEVLE